MNLTLIAIIALGAAILVLVVWIIILERRIGRLLSGKNSSSLEDTITTNQASISELYKLHNDLLAQIARIDLRIKKKIHGAKTLRFNPFAGSGTGGNQSFATAFLDEEGNGVVLSSLYSREKVSIFAKPVINRTSEFELTEEERQVLT